MSPRVKLFAALGAAGIGLVALLGVMFGTKGSVRSHIAGKYQRVEAESRGRSAVYTSTQPPGAVARSIAGAWKPAERVNDPGGYFLRYRTAIVAVTAAGAGQQGSRIYVDDQRDGYNRWYPYVGGVWGTFSGPGETFRGGGPAAGK
ncbi:MAG TPA: DUF4247 domain-containing protein [Acidimicrobiia bacterium]|nr:DUF4247 domain-containing protein [Acidimicrobiia bacterium]